ncbi:MAG TPA: IS6 family transposase, partial [Paracoccaceae bacterium]|nr:IS6 family transposase [Paracoccaceae bacterium]
KKPMKRFGAPQVIVTGKHRSCEAAMMQIGNAERQEAGRWQNNRRGISQLPFRRREQAKQRFRKTHCLQKFAAVYYHLNQKHSLSTRNIFKQNRANALAEWRGLGVNTGAAPLSLPK